MAVEPEDVYGRILARAERSELETQCRAVVERDMAAVGRRIKQAAVVLARIREIEAAAGQLQHDQQKPSLRVNKANCEHIAVIRDLHMRIFTTLERIVKQEGLPEPVTRSKRDKLSMPQKTTTESAKQSAGSKSSPNKVRGKKRLRAESNEIASFPAFALTCEQELAKLSHAHQFTGVLPSKFISVGPTTAAIDKPSVQIGDGSDESPIEIELIESDSEEAPPTCYDSAVQLQQASTSVQLTQFPLLIRRFTFYLDSLGDVKLQAMEGTFVSALEIAIDIGLSLPLSDSTRAAPVDLLTVVERLKAAPIPLPSSLTRRAAELSEYLVDDNSHTGDGHRLEINSQDQLVMRVDV